MNLRMFEQTWSLCFSETTPGRLESPRLEAGLSRFVRCEVFQTALQRTALWPPGG